LETWQDDVACNYPSSCQFIASQSVGNEKFVADRLMGFLAAA
jgi:hypothetical protein